MRERDRRRLILFDVDGTLVDSQDDIVRAMELSFEALGLTPPQAAGYYWYYRPVTGGRCRFG